MALHLHILVHTSLGAPEAKQLLNGEPTLLLRERISELAGDYYPIREFDGLSLAIMPRPRAGDWLEHEIELWQREGLDTVVSLLEPPEIAELGLGTEPGLCAGRGIEFRSFPIPDRGVPISARAFDSFLAPVVQRLLGGAAVGVHCRAGIGRAGLTAACILVRAGIPYPLAFPAISRARRVQVPDTEQQEQWVQSFAASGSAVSQPFFSWEAH
jgi:protein-tyrosine phosphatase